MVRRGARFHAGAAALWLAAAGCGGTCARPPDARREAPAPTAEPPADVEVKLAYAQGRSLCVRAARPSGLGEARCAEAKAPIEQALWIDGARIAALVQGAAVILEPSGELRELPMPPPSTWDRPPPLDSEGKLQFGSEPSTLTHLYVEKGALWMARCPWWLPFDAGYCDEWVEARLLPGPMEVRSMDGPPPGFKETSRDFPAGEKPEGVEIEVRSPDGGEEVTVECRRGEERASRVEERRGTHLTIEWSWIGQSPSSYLVRVERDVGEAVLASIYWMEACRKDPVRELGEVMAGPDLFWIHLDDSHDGWTVRYGEREVTSVEASWIAFAKGP